MCTQIIQMKQVTNNRGEACIREKWLSRPKNERRRVVWLQSAIGGGAGVCGPPEGEGGCIEEKFNHLHLASLGRRTKASRSVASDSSWWRGGGLRATRGGGGVYRGEKLVNCTSPQEK
jgi:hypothetical protein